MKQEADQLKQKFSGEVKKGNPEMRGVSLCREGINLTVKVLQNQEVSLLLYRKDKKSVQSISFPAYCRVGDTASILLPWFDTRKYTYAYCIDGRVLSDPYACLIRGGKCEFVQKTSWISEEDLIKRPFEEMIIYKLHVRGFSRLAGTDIEKKGTFRGVEESIPYFKELGINTVEFMPMYEWNSELRTKNNLKNYWGYAEQNYYLAPKEIYAATDDPMKECRQMIQSLHKAGISCIMEFYVPKGTEPSMVLDAISYWKLYYGIDGFHLIGEGVLAESIVCAPLLKNTVLFFDRIKTEWHMGRERQQQRYLSEYNSDFMYRGRHFLKGDEGQILEFMNLMRRNEKTYGVVNYMANHNGFTLRDMVSYNEKHNEQNLEHNRDGMTADDVWNCGEEGETKKESIQALRLKQMKNAMLYVLLAQGIPLIYQGDELGNSQSGNNNAYAMDNEVGWVNWNTDDWLRPYRSFVKEAIAFRKEHPVLHQKKPLRLSDYIECGYPDISYHTKDAWYPLLDHKSRSIACMYCGAYARKSDAEEDDDIYVAYNGDQNPEKFALPKLPDQKRWQVALLTEEDQKTEFRKGQVLENQKSIIVPAHTVLVLISKQE